MRRPSLLPLCWKPPCAGGGGRGRHDMPCAVSLVAKTIVGSSHLIGVDTLVEPLLLPSAQRCSPWLSVLRPEWAGCSRAPTRCCCSIITICPPTCH